MSVSHIATYDGAGQNAAVTIAVAAATSGRLMLLNIAYNGPTSGVTLAAGWTEILSEQAGSGSDQISIVRAWKFSTGEQEATYTVGAAASVAVVNVFAGVAESPIDVFNVDSVLTFDTLGDAMDSLTPSQGDYYLVATFPAVGVTSSNDTAPDGMTRLGHKHESGLEINAFGELLATADPTGERSKPGFSTVNGYGDTGYRSGVVLVPEARDRVRSNVSEDAGSILEATTVIPVDNAVQEAFLPGVTLAPSNLQSFLEFLRPDVVAARYFPVPTRNREYLKTYAGETKLGRMARTYPQPIMGRIADLAHFGGASTATAQEVLEYIFTTWASEFNWFSYESVPDLRLLIGAAVGNEKDYYVTGDATAGKLEIEAVAIPQETGNRRNMRQIVDEWLAIFPGTILRQNSRGNIELVPRVGPDVPDVAHNLAWRDLYDITEGEDDPRGVINRCRVESTGYEFVADQAVIAPTYYIHSTDGLAESVLEAEGVHPKATREGVGFHERIDFDGIVEPSDIEVSLTGTVYGSHDKENSNNFSVEGTDSDTLTLGLGESGTFTMLYTSRSTTYSVSFEISRDATTGELYVSDVTGHVFSYASNPIGRTYLAYVLEIDATGKAWTESGERIVGEFGYSSEDSLPADGGGNLLEQSVAAYGDREATVSGSVIKLTAEQAQEIAQAYVLANINPRTIREVEQAVWNKFPVTFEDVGSRVDLPNGERVLVQNRTYQDAFTVSGGAMSSAFQAVVTEELIDTSTTYLFDERGAYLHDESGDYLEDEVSA